jgi:PKD repeat protein
MADESTIENEDIADLITFKETDASGADVPFVGTINAEKTVINIDPVADLANGQLYYLALNNEVIRFQEGALIPGQSITFTTVAGQKPYLALDVQDNFEADGWGTITDWKFQDSENLVDLTVIDEPGNPSNHVADYNRSGAFLYTNAQFVLDHRMDLTQRNKFKLKVYFPSSNNYTGSLIKKAAIKLQNSLLGGNAWTTQKEVLVDVTVLDQWVTLTFDFFEVANRDDFDQVVVQLGGEAHNDPGQFYFDDIQLLPVQTGPNADFSAAPTSGFAPLSVQFTNLSTGSSQYAWDFENDGVIDSNAENPSHTYDAPGSYSVKLQIGNVFNGDIEIKENDIVVTEFIEPPYIYTDFDENINHTFEGWPNMPETIANPDPSGMNISANVGRWARSTEVYANIYKTFDNTINFSEGSIFTLQVYAPIECEVLFKLESTLTGQSTQRFASVSSAEEWQMLGFDFSGEQSDVYDEIIIFFDFGNDVDNLFYFDDIRGPEPNGIPLYKPLLALDVQDNFEDDGYATIDQWFFQDPDLVPLNIVDDPVNPANHVADYNRSGSFEWTNAQFILDHRMDLSERNQFQMKVFFPSTDNYAGSLTDSAAVKLQNSLLGEFAYTTQTEIVLPVGQHDQWITLQFDFSDIADSVNYDQVVVQFGGEGHFEPGQFYFDDFNLMDVQLPYMQTIILNEGWSGISSYVVPENSNIIDMLEPIIDDVEIIVGPTGYYYPANGNNTLGNWNSQDGYIIKISAENQLIIAGNELAGLSLNVPAGWSALPVLSSCTVSIEDLLDGSTEVVMIKDVAGKQVYWPEKEIFDLEVLQPGVAYYILTNAALSVTFPECAGEYSLIWSDEFNGTEVNVDN